MLKKSRLHTVLAGAALACGVLLLASCTSGDFPASATATENAPDTTVSGKVVSGLKTALQVGIDSSSIYASKLNGYYANKAIKILLPIQAELALAGVQQVDAYMKPFTSQLKSMQSLVSKTPGLDQASFQSHLNASVSLLTDIALLETLSDSVMLYMNRAAEYAAPRSVPIFKDAIKGLSISDGLTLLNSADSTAATSFLKARTFDTLISAYAPIIDSTMAKVPFAQYWSQYIKVHDAVMGQYYQLLYFQQAWDSNSVVTSLPDLQVPALKPVYYNPIMPVSSIASLVTNKALSGLFYLAGEQEKDIRRDPFAYIKGLAADISGILGEVFGQIMKMPS